MTTTSTCPGSETLAAFGEGRLPRAQAAEVMAHIEGCDDCIAALEAVSETIATRNVVGFRKRNLWLAAAAAAVVIAVLSFVVTRDREPMHRLIALAPRSARPVEARLSGGFPWAAYRGPMRAEDVQADPQRMKLIGTAGDLVAAADRDRSARAQQIAGVALLVIDEPMPAIARLRAAVDASPNDAKAWSDLAAAQYAAALRFNRTALLPESLASTDRALRIDPRLPEALFNRALVVERLGLVQEARAAWQRYLEVDPSSPWAAEARERLSKLAATPAASNAQSMRTFAEAETLGRWAEAVQRGDETIAKRELEQARAVGETLAHTSGESLLQEAVRAIDHANLAEAHALYKRGRIAYSKRELDAALADLDRAAQLFGSTPMSLLARYYAASARFDRNDVAAARQQLETLLADANSHPRFIALGALVRWELALCLMVDGDWSGALPLLDASRASLVRLDERNHLGFVESLLADTLLSLGRADAAWAARTRAFALLSENGSGDRLPMSLKGAAQMEMRRGRLTTARALLDVAHASAIASDAIAADVLIHRAMADVALGDSDAATRSLREGAAAADRIRDASTRELAHAHLEVAGAAALVKADPSRAREMLTRAIAAYQAKSRTVFLPESYLLRARADASPDEATADLESGIEALEHSRIRTGGIVGTGVLNAGVALFEDAIRLSADRGDVEQAFAYAERSRAQLGSAPADLAALQQQLRSSDAAVLQIVALPQELVVICVTATDKALVRHPMRRDAIESLASRAAKSDEDKRALGELHELIVRPFEALLAHSDQLIVIADRSLQSIPFPALYDATAKRYLIERFAVSMAMSASALRPVGKSASHQLLAVGLPSGESAAGLPESASEIAGVSALYANAVTIAPERATFAAFADAAPRADVIHIAGHTERQSDDSGNALVFAKERVTWSAIAQHPLPHSPVVVLAACETLQPLGNGFLAAGARDVVGTLTPIADADARDLFQSIHRHLAAGSAAADAVRAAQIEALARQSNAWRSIESLTRCINTKRS